MKELNEALMDRTKAGQIRRSKIKDVKGSDCSLDSDKQSNSENQQYLDKPVEMDILS